MAVDFKLAAQRRAAFGTAACRRLRRQGIIPGNLYGHGAEPVSINVAEDIAQRLVQTRAQVVDVDLDGESAIAVVREVQWDTYTTYVQHIDLVRVDSNERMSVEVGIELRGIAKGVSGGGVMEQPLHSLKIDCLAIDIPEKITVRIGDLDIDQAIHVSDLDLPEGTDVLTPPETLIVRVIKPVDIDEEDAAEIGPAEPEVIGRKADDAESAEDS